MDILSRLLIILGLVMLFTGLLIKFVPHIPILGRLPGDIIIQREHFTFYFPLSTSLLISAILTLLINLLKR